MIYKRKKTAYNESDVKKQEQRGIDMKEQTERNMGSPKTLVVLSMPIFLELFLQLLVGNVDQFMVSRYSQTGVAAIGNANQIMNMVVIIFSVISISTTILVSLYRGAGDQQRAEVIYSLSVFVNTIISLSISVLLVALARPIFTAMQVPDDVMEEAVLYISIIGSCLLLQGLYNTFVAIFRSNALMKETMSVAVLINVLNIGVNAILIPHIGIAGAAIASNFSRLVGLLIMVYLFHRKVEGRLSLKMLKPFPLGQLKTLLSIGLPSGGESVSYTGSQLAIQTMSNTFGTAVVTAKTYGTMFAMVSYLYANAISQASQIVVGHLMGARDETGVQRQVRWTMAISVLVSLGMSVAIYFLCPLVLSFLTDNETVIALTQAVLFVDIFLEIGRAINMTMVRDLQTVGDIFFPIAVGVISMWLVSVLGGFLLGIVLQKGLLGFWIAMAADECFRGVLFVWRWKSGKWRGKNLVEK